MTMTRKNARQRKTLT